MFVISIADKEDTPLPLSSRIAFDCGQHTTAKSNFGLARGTLREQENVAAWAWP